MKYLNRNIETTVMNAAKMFTTVLVTGARQVGKTTLLKHLENEIPYLTLDDPILLQSAREEAGSFFKTNPPPIIVDESGNKGQFFLTGFFLIQGLQLI